jgi:hypothetical protein
MAAELDNMPKLVKEDSAVPSSRVKGDRPVELQPITFDDPSILHMPAPLSPHPLSPDILSFDAQVNHNSVDTVAVMKEQDMLWPHPYYINKVTAWSEEVAESPIQQDVESPPSRPSSLSSTFSTNNSHGANARWGVGNKAEMNTGMGWKSQKIQRHRSSPSDLDFDGSASYLPSSSASSLSASHLQPPSLTSSACLSLPPSATYSLPTPPYTSSSLDSEWFRPPPSQDLPTDCDSDPEEEWIGRLMQEESYAHLESKDGNGNDQKQKYHRRTYAFQFRPELKPPRCRQRSCST